MPSLVKRSKGKNDIATLCERLIVGAYSTVAALVLGSIAWLFLEITYNFGGHVIPFMFVVSFAALVGIAGFLLNVNLVVEMLLGAIRIFYDEKQGK